MRMNEQAHAICAGGLAAWEEEKMTPYTNLRNELGEMGSSTPVQIERLTKKQHL